LCLRNGFGGPKYDAAVQQFRTEMAATKNKGLFRGEEFQTTLAAAIKSCDSNELPQVLSVVHGLLAADPEARRDFFVNKLLIPCLNEIPRDISETGTEIDAKSLIGKSENLLTINGFCVSKKVELSAAEGEQIEKLIPTEAQLTFTIAKAICGAITDSGSERDLCLRYLKHVRSSALTSGNGALVGMHFETFDAMEKNGDFPNLLQCFGTERNEQIKNFKSLVDGLYSIGKRVKAEHGRAKGPEEALVKKFTQKANEFLLGNQELMWAMLRMLKTNIFFLKNVLPKFFECIGGADDRFSFLPLASRQTMKENKTLTDEQVQLLCGGVDLADLLRDTQDVEKNKDTIDTILKFIQNRALTSTAPKISFEDIMPADDISDKTYQRLVEFVEQGTYSKDLKAFIRNGRPAQGTPSNP
jgi:hypothetical protein